MRLCLTKQQNRDDRNEDAQVAASWVRGPRPSAGEGLRALVPGLAYLALTIGALGIAVGAGVAVVAVGGCGERTLGGPSDLDGSTHGDAGDDGDGGEPGPDGMTPGPDGDVPLGCEPQEAYEDPTVDCDHCGWCADALPWRWTGDRCAFEPVCCACAGADCDRRYARLADCEAARADCPHALLEVEYPAAKLRFHMTAGAAGHGPLLEMDGFGEMRTWLYASTPAPEEPPDYIESFGLAQANQLFGTLMDIDLRDLPHDTGPEGECYSQLWIYWEDSPAYDPIVIGYPSADALRPELNPIYEFFDRRLCRGEGVSGYPQTLPSGYCEFF